MIKKILKRVGLRWNFRPELESYFAYSYTLTRLKSERKCIDQFLEQHPLAKDTLFSLVIPLWGIKSVYINELFDSIERQSYPHWEVCICVDGDEQVDLNRLLFRYRKRWKQRLKVARHDGNKGISAATKTALELAEGDVIAFVDGDDLLHSRALECFAAAFADSPQVEFVYSDMDYITDWGLRHNPVYKPAWSPHLLKTAMYIGHLKCVRTELLNRCPGIFDSRFDGSQDWHFALQATAEARRVMHIPLVLYHWRKRKGSLADDSSAKPWAFKAAYALQAEHFQALDESLTLAYHPNLVTPPGPLPKVRTRPLVLVRVATSACPRFGYLPEPQQFLYMREISLPSDGAMWDAVLLGLPEDSLLLFQCDSREAFYGEISVMEAFAAMSDVGAVWPVIDVGVRYGYTIAEPGWGWSPLGMDLSFFSANSSNILTGPLHGLMIEWRKLQKLGGFTALALGKCDNDFEVGIEIGLECLNSGYRNISATAVHCPQELPFIPAAHAHMCDPYSRSHIYGHFGL